MRYHYFLIFTLTLLLAAVNVAFAQLPWTKHNDNPVLTTGEAGEWDSEDIQVDAVIFDGEIYHMWYTGSTDTSDGVGYATSSDRINWTKYENNPVFLKGETGQWDDEFAGSVTVIQIDTLFHMWYGGAGESNFGSIGHATSADGINWMRNPANPVLEAGEAGSWDRGAVQQPSVIYDGEKFHMWYHGASANFTLFEIGYASSEDGISWTKHEENPVIKRGPQSSWDYGAGIISPSVIKKDSVFHLWYQSLSPPLARFGYATSTNGIDWEKYASNPVFEDEGDVFSPTVILDGKDFLMWYGLYTDKTVVNLSSAPVHLNVPMTYPTIQTAIDSSRDGDVVLVADGTYMENINFKGKAITVASHYYVDGDTNHINNTIIDGSNPAHPDSGSVVTLDSGEDTTSVLYGLTISGGSGTRHILTFEDGSNIEFRSGGGILCDSSSVKLISNKIIRNQINDEIVSGGGIAIFGNKSYEPYLILEKNLVTDNSVKGSSSEIWAQGGGVHLSSASARIIDNIFARDSVYGFGGASGGVDIFGIDHFPEAIIKNNIFKNNIVVASKSGAIGGGMTLAWTDVTIIEGNVFAGNKTICNSPEGWAQGGALCVTDQESSGYGQKIIRKNKFSGNSVHSETSSQSINGGGLYLYKSYASISANEFLNNSASSASQSSSVPTGGGIGVYESRFRIENNILTHNSADVYGGAIDINRQQSGISAPQLLANNTIYNNNSSTRGGGISVRSSAKVVAINNILWANNSLLNSEVHAGANLKARYNNIQGGYTGDGNIETNPAFMDTLDFYLQDISGSIGAGRDSVEIDGYWFVAPAYDFYGNMRPNPEGSLPDIGAYESPYEKPVSIEKEVVKTPLKFALDPNFPNPFNPTTTISYKLAKNSAVELAVFNALGQKLAILVDQKQSAGSYMVTWDASGFASGVYFYRLQTDKGFSKTRKLILVK